MTKRSDEHWIKWREEDLATLQNQPLDQPLDYEVTILNKDLAPIEPRARERGDLGPASRFGSKRVGFGVLGWFWRLWRR